MNPKRILAFVVFVVLSVNATAATKPGFLSSVVHRDSGIDVTISTPLIELSDVTLEGKSFQSIKIESDVLMGTVGGPGIPASSIMVEIPAGMAPSLSFDLGETRVMEHIKLAPLPISSPDNSKMPKNLFRHELYEQDVLIPEEVVSLSPSFQIGGQSYAVLKIAPCQYNPVRQSLQVYSTVQASVEFVPAQNIPPTRKFDAPVWRELSEALSDGPVRDDISVSAENLGHLVIVIPNNDGFANSIAPLVAWKKRMGYVVTVVRMVRDVQNTEAALKAYLQSAWEEWELPPTYILLVGESTQMPSFRDNDNEGVSWYYSDNQYVTYGYNEGNEIDGWIPQSFIGRLPAQSPGEAAQMVTKIVGYESTPFVQQSWVEGGIMIAAGVHSCIQTNQAVREQMIDYGYLPNRVREAYAEYHAGQPNVDPNTVSDAVNNGVGFVNFRGYDTWGGYTTGQIRSLRNGWRLPVVTGMVCATNDFANRFGTESIGEAWVRAYNNDTPAGAIACYGPTDRHTHTWFNNTMDGEFYRLLLRRGVHTLGALCTGSKIALLRNYPSLLNLGNGESVGYYFFAYNLLGDPSLIVRTRNPEAMTVTFHENVAVGTTNLLVSVFDADDEPLEGAYVHVYGDDDHRFGAYTDENGEALIVTTPLEQGALKLTVTAVNFVPILDQINVAPQSSMVSFTALEISDDNEGESQGNNDHAITPGETIELVVTLANRGSDALQNMTAELECANPYVNITRTSASFGTLDNDEDGVSDEPYLIEVRPETPSGTKLDFLLTVTSGQDHFSIYFSRFVVGYDLDVTNHFIVGDEPFAPGTTRRLVVTLDNIGSLSTENLTGVLYCDDRSLQISGAETRFDPIEAGDGASNAEHPFELTAGPNAYMGGEFNFGLLLEDEAGLRDSVSFRMTLGEPSVTSPQGPDDYGYWAIDSRDTLTGLEPTYERLQGNVNLNIVDNNDVTNPVGIGGAVRAIDLPFVFTFYGERYRKVTVSSNGFIAFGESVSIGWNNQELGSGLVPAPIVAPWWDDLYGGSVFTRFDEDNSRFIIEWRNFTLASAGTVNISVVLYDPTVNVTATGDGEIVVNYTEIPAQRDLPDEAVTIGIASPDSKTALTVRHAHTSDMRTGLLRSGMAVKFTTGESEEVGSIQGSVSEFASGAPLQGVRVMIEGTGFFATTNVNGEYRIDGAAIGTYSVLARKRYFNSDGEADVEIRQDEVTQVNFSLTQPNFSIDIDEIEVIVPPDSIRYRHFQVTNNGNGPLDYDVALDFISEEPQQDTLWSVMFDWDVSAVTGEQTMRGVAASNDFFYFSGQRQRAIFPHPMYVLNKLGERVGEFNQVAVDSAARGYANVDFNGVNLVGVEDTTIVEFTEQGEFVRSIPMPDGQSSFGVAFSPTRGTYFTKAITGNIIFELDPDGNVVGEHSTPGNVFRTYGFAWFPADPDGYNFYALRLNQENALTELWRMNPENDDWLFVRSFTLQEGDTPLDLVITKRFDPLAWTLAILVNHQGGDHLIGYKIAENTSWISFDPKSGSVPSGANQAFEVVFMAEDMPRDDYHVVLKLTHNAEGEVFEIPVTFTVGDEVNVKNEDPLPSLVGFESLYPNPFNSRANIAFTIPKAGQAFVVIYDVGGRELRKLDLGKLEAGRHSTWFEGEGLSSGVYLVKIESAAGSMSQKMVLLR